MTNNIGVGTVVSTVRAALDGAQTWSVSYGRTNHTAVTRDRVTASRTETLTRPDGTQSVSVYTNGLLMSVTDKDASGNTIATRSMVYDAFLRLTETREPAASGETRTTVQAYNPAGATTNTTTSAGGLSRGTSHVLDTMGRRVQTVFPDNGIVTRAFSPRGELTQESGARTYPVTYTYTEQGRVSTLSTYRNGLAGSPDVTRWNYDSGRGWLTAKIYADGSSNRLEYTGAGLLLKKTSAREIETENGYGPDGAVTNIAYSDGTPTETYGVDRMGRRVTVADGTGARANTYADDGQLISETDPITGWSLEYPHDALGRRTGIVVKNGAGETIYQTAYAFDSAGRLCVVSNGAVRVVYAYGADGVSVTNIAFNGAMTTRKVYDGLNKLTQISSWPSNGNPVRYEYSYNMADLRTTAALADGSEWRYAYDSLGQVTEGKKRFADGIPVGGCRFAYKFDTIGNRVTAEEGDMAALFTYTANNMNQYSQRTVPGVVLVTGTADSNATVSIRLDANNAVLANRHSDYFWGKVAVNNAALLFHTTNIQIRAVKTSGTNSLVRTQVRHATVPQTPEALIWDADGNLTQDGLWTNKWDGQNRLIEMESLSVVPEEKRMKLLFQYDSEHRRRRKTVLTGYSGGAYSGTSIVTYVWSGWLPIAEIGMGYTNWYTHGLDLSSTFQGAGGVGGLLAMTRDIGTATNTYLYSFDGNGNVINLVDASNGSIAATYEYSPFGQIIRSAGPMASNNPVRWSTKHTDDETGLVMYEFRPYSPDLGRWLSNDPIGEWGGGNLYAFVENEPIGTFDILGKFGTSDHKSLTDSAFLSALSGSGLDAQVTGGVRAQIKTKLKDANTDQDSYIPPKILDYRRHYLFYNPGSEPPPYPITRSIRDNQYETYLTSEDATFGSALNYRTLAGCEDALAALGRMSHSWQDFYAHAIRNLNAIGSGPVNASGGSENSPFPGFTAFSVGITGNPDSRGNFWPSRFGWEHPLYLVVNSEPVTPGTAEWAARYAQAWQFAKDRFTTPYLPMWWDTCKCLVRAAWGP